MARTIIGYLQLVRDENPDYPFLLSNAVLLKMSAGSMPEDPLVAQGIVANAGAGLVNFCIVLNQNDDPTSSARFEAYRGKYFVPMMEAVVKHPGDPSERFLSEAGSEMSIGNFLPFYDLPTGLAKSSATCCSTTPTAIAVSPYADWRAQWDYMANYSAGGNAFRVFTFDRPDLLDRYLTGIGLRDTSSIIWSPYEGDHGRP